MEVINSGKEKGMVVLAIKGRMDAVTAPEFDKQIGSLIESGETYFALDFEGVEYISSAGLRSVLAAGKKLKTANGKLLIASLRGTAKEVFEISGFDSLFPVFENVQAAVASL